MCRAETKIPSLRVRNLKGPESLRKGAAMRVCNILISRPPPSLRIRFGENANELVFVAWEGLSKLRHGFLRDHSLEK